MLSKILLTVLCVQHVAGVSDFFKAVAAGDVPVVIKLLWNSQQDKEALLNEQTRSQKTPLDFAVARGDIELITLLLEAGAPLVTPNTDDSPIHRAAWNSRPEILELLLKYCNATNLDYPNKYGDTPLCSAINGKNVGNFKKLLDYGANAEAFNPVTSDRPVHNVACHGTAKMLRYLVEKKNVNVDIENDDGQTPLMLAAQFGNNAVLYTLLMNGAEKNKRDKERGYTALHNAVTHGNLFAVKALLHWGAETFIRCMDDNTPFLLSTKLKERNEEIIKYLEARSIHY